MFGHNNPPVTLRPQIDNKTSHEFFLTAVVPLRHRTLHQFLLIWKICIMK